MAIVYKNGSVSSEEAVPYAIAGGQTLTDGDFVYAGADGTITEAAANSAALLGRVRLYYGPDTSNAGVVLGYPDTEFVITGNAAKTAAQAQVYVGAFYDLVVAASGEHQLDLTNSSTNVFKIVAVEDVATRKYRVIINPAISQAMVEV